MQLIDSHCHVNFGAFKDDWRATVDRALEAGVGMINVGTNFATSKRSVEIAEEVGDGMWAAIGVHPIHLAKAITERASFNGEDYSFTTKQEVFDKRRYWQIAQSKKVVAIGESGLDYFHLEDFKADNMTAQEYVNLQQETLYEILTLGRELELPHIFHCRDAYDDFIEIVSDFNDNSDGGGQPGGEVRGVVHCFTGNIEQARKILELGLYIGFTGIVTFPNAQELQEVAKFVPLDRMLLETDSPYLAPQAVRGQRNEPAHVHHVAEQIATLKGESIERVREQILENTRKALNLS
jgi:TatD DNase family protein